MTAKGVFSFELQSSCYDRPIARLRLVRTLYACARLESPPRTFIEDHVVSQRMFLVSSAPDT